MAYETGDYVFPTDLPRRFLCQVVQAEMFNVGGASTQILRLEPLEGPWPRGTMLIRLDPSVVRAGTRDLWNRCSAHRRSSEVRPRRIARAA